MKTVNIPEEIFHLSVASDYVIDGKRTIGYVINLGSKTPEDYWVTLPQVSRYDSTDKICDENEEFVNGFKLVRTEVKPHGSPEFAYIEEKTGKLLPYRFDIATDFNQYGLAMVGKDGHVTWINKEFKMLKHDDYWVFQELKPIDLEFDKTGRLSGGFSRVYSFSKGEFPLAKVYEGRRKQGFVAFLRPSGTLQHFRDYDGASVSQLEGNSEFPICSNFDENGIAVTERGILLAEGFEISNENIINILKGKGTLLEIKQDALQCQKEQEEKGSEVTKKLVKTLIKTVENNKIKKENLEK